MAHTLPPHLTDPRPDLTLRGHVEIGDHAFFLYGSQNDYLATTSDGNALTESPCDGLEGAIAAIAQAAGIQPS